MRMRLFYVGKRLIVPEFTIKLPKISVYRRACVIKGYKVLLFSQCPSAMIRFLNAYEY